MPTEFVYKARDRNGVAVEGVVRFETAAAVRDYIADRDLIPISIQPKRKTSLRKALDFFRAKTSHEDLILFTRKLNALYRAGIPITQSLGIIADQDVKHSFSDIAAKLRIDIEQGYSFSDAVAQHLDVFDRTYISAIRVAENSGRLDVVLDKLATSLERDLETREQIKTAIRYPIMVVVMVCIAFTVLVTFVVPKFAEFYRKYNAQLPLPTRILINLNKFISQYWPFLLMLVVIVIPVIFKLFKTKRFRDMFDGLVLKVPVFGQLLNKIYIARFAHLLEVTFSSGAPLLTGLDVVRTAIGNRVIENEVEIMRSSIQQGNSLGNVRNLLPHFSNLVISLMQVGLESGSLEFMLKQIATFFDREVDYTTRRLMSLIEPFLMVFLGGVVLCLALAIFLPMWNLIQIFKPH